jgi:hypothetical protein
MAKDWGGFWVATPPSYKFNQNPKNFQNKFFFIFQPQSTPKKQGAKYPNPVKIVINLYPHINNLFIPL